MIIFCQKEKLWLMKTISIIDDAIIPKTIFHYTSFEKFKCILQYGTWRFKLSTQSNDLLDTTYIVEIIKKLEIQKNLTDDHRKLLEMLIGYFKRDEYERQFLSYVTCFTDKSDSRLLWDAYTINRPITNLDDVRDYNGVCIGVNRDKLLNTLQSKKPEYCDAGFLAPIYYTPQQQMLALDFLCKNALDNWDKTKDDEDQSQDIVPTIRTAYAIKFGDYVGKPHCIEMNLKKSFVNAMLSYIESVEKTAPYLKHQFWEEESEYRASLNMHVSKKPKHDYIDLDINEEIIDCIILGPTFSGKEEEIIRKIDNAKLDFSKIKKEKSVGTGIIQMN